MGVMVEPMSGIVSSRSALLMAWKRPWPSVAMQDNVFQHHDGVVDHQADGRSESAKSHQVKTLTCHFQNDKGDQEGCGYH